MPSLAPAKPRDRKDNDEQGSSNDADTDRTPHRRRQDSDPEVRRFGKSPRRATPKGHKTFIYYTTLPKEDDSYIRPPSAFVAHMHEHVGVTVIGG